MPSRIPNPEIDAALEVIDEWQRKGKAIRTTYTFDGFRQAFDFMVEIAEIADVRQHHPDWHNLYNKVTIELTTHDFGGVTDLDLEFASIISQLYDKHRTR